MPYRLRKRETLADGLRRIAGEQCERAARALAGTPTDEQIHEARVRIKRVRAVLRLVRGSMPGAREEDRSLAGAARALAGSRDAASLCEAMALLRNRFGTLDPGAFARAAAALEGRAQAARGGVGAGSIELARHTLAATAERAAAWRIETEGFDVLRAGLERSYARVRRGRRAALASGDPSERHAWRTVVKRLGEQVRLLERAWPEVLGPQGAALRTIAERLGVDHDLCLLAAALRERPEEFGEPGRARAIALLAERMAREEVRDCRRAARRALAEKPGAFVARVEGLWEAWRA